MTDPALFALSPPRVPAGRVRKGLDADARAAAADGVTIPAAGLASLRTLADRIDQLDRHLRSPGVSAYDHVPLTGLLREFRETYAVVFAARAGEDPFTRAFHDFLAADAARADAGTPPGDTAGPATD